MAALQVPSELSALRRLRILHMGGNLEEEFEAQVRRGSTQRPLLHTTPSLVVLGGGGATGSRCWQAPTRVRSARRRGVLPKHASSLPAPLCCVFLTLHLIARLLAGF